MRIHTGRAVGSVAGVAVAAMLAASPALAAPPAGSDTTTLQVVTATGDPTTGWVEQAYDCNDNGPFITPSQDFVEGPGTPVLGAGSHTFTTGQFRGQTELFRTEQFDGTYASDITHLVYSTFAKATDANDTTTKQPAYLRLSFDTNGDTTPDAFLYYEPSINHPDAVASGNGTWQSWDPTNEEWSTDGSPDNLTTLQQFAQDNPTARIMQENDGSEGGVSFIVGCAGDAQSNGLFAVDGFGIRTTDATPGDEVTPPAKNLLFDFDPPNEGTDDQGTITVDDAHAHGWNAAAFNDTSDLTPNQSMVFGPGTPPAGNGSHKFRVTDQSVVELYRSPELDGDNVGDIRQLDYSTFEQPDSGNTTPQQPAYLRLSVDTDGDGVGDTSLYYEPSINHPDDIQSGTWQRWNTADELWSINGGEDPSDLTTLAGFAANHPQSTIHEYADSAGHGGLSIIVGCGCDNQDNANFYVDDVSLDFFHGAAPDTTESFDFEPTVPTPTISAPNRVVGRSQITVSGTAVPNSTVNLFEKVYGHSTQQVDSTTADSDGNYSFQRTVSKLTRFRVTNYGHPSAVATVHVAIKVNLTLTSPRTGRLHMHVSTSPWAPDQTVRFYRVFSDGSRKLLAKTTTNSRGRAGATVKEPSGHTIKVVATVTAPPGNERGQSAEESIVIS